MLVKIEKPKDLAEAISIISEIVTEVRIKLLPEGMSIIAVDPANVAMVIFKIPKESFSQYEPGREVWSVNLEDLKRILKRASTSGSIVLEQEENQLKIAIFDKVKRNFVLSLIELETEEKDEPALTFGSRVEMDSDSLSQSIEDCLVVADSCSLITSKGLFFVEGNGSLNSAKAEYSSDEVKLSGEAKSKYSLEYISKFMKAKKISQKAVINFGDDYPLRLEFPGEKMGIAFILAPRVENN